MTLNNEKALREGDISINISKDVIDTYLPILTNVINSSIEQNKSANELKLADVLPIYKKKYLLNKDSYRSVRLLSYMSIVFERFCINKLKHL